MTKLYAGLTDTERAVLAFNYRAKHNDLETARIQSTMRLISGIGDQRNKLSMDLRNINSHLSIRFLNPPIASYLPFIVGT